MFIGSVPIVVFVMLWVQLITGCPGTQIQYPNTPKGRALLYLTTYEKQVANYQFKSQLPNLLEEEKRILRNQRFAMIEAHTPLVVYCEYVASGQLPTLEMDQLITRWLEEIARWALRDAGAQSAISDDQIRQLIYNAGAADRPPAFKKQSIDPGLVIILIELAKAAKDFLFSLTEQAGMTPDQIDANFVAGLGRLQAFNPADLVVVQ